MKTKQKKPRRGMSLGTRIMLLLTAGVLAASAVFMAAIAGETLRSRAHEAAQMVERAGLTLMSEAESALLRKEERERSVAQSAAPAPRSLQATSEPAHRPPVTFTIAAAGAIHAPKPVLSGAKMENGEYDFSQVFSGLGDALSGADLAIATLETMTAGEKKGYDGTNAPSALLDALRSLGVDVLSVGTEHALDKGYDGLAVTISEMTARGIAHTGAAIEKARDPGVVGSIEGVQVAVLGFTYGLSEEGEKAASAGEQEAVARLEMERMEQDIRMARAAGAEVLIVTPHWGTKNKQETPESVRKMALALAQAGADVILGTHPNVVQGTERLTVTRADGLEYETVVCYSLGSLLSDARTEENTAGMVAQMAITYDPQTRRVTLGSLACVPVYIAMQREDGENVYRVVDVENAQAMSALTAQQQEEAQNAARRVREITGQSRMEDEGQG